MATARESMLLSVRWNKKLIIDPILYRLDTCKSSGEKTLVGRYTNNGQAIQQRFDQNLRSIAVAATRN